MAYASLGPEDLRALEQTRQKFQQLTSTISSLKNTVERSHPLPPWSSLQISATMLAKSMQSMTDHLANNSEIMNRVVVYPSTNYPGRTQEGLLGMLLRKKLEPPVESLVEQAREIQIPGDKASREGNEEMGDWATGWLGPRAAEWIENEIADDYTPEEREIGLENVKTGLKRKLRQAKPDEESDEEAESEDEEMEDVQDVGLGITMVSSTDKGPVEFSMGETKKRPNGMMRTEDDILRFATSGATIPPPAPPVRR